MNTTLEINLADILEQKYPHGFHAPADIEISNFLEFADDDWSHEIDLEQLLAEKHMIGVSWNVRLVLDERPDLTDEQAWKVLQACQPQFEEVTDAMVQIVRDTASHFFPAPRGKDALRAYLTRIGEQIEALPECERTDPVGFRRLAGVLDAIHTSLKGDIQ